MSVLYTCDRPGCGKTDDQPMQIELVGYYPKNASGILLPEGFRKFQFCSHACFVKWTRWAMTLEPQEGKL
jgi:hypothetical protein